MASVSSSLLVGVQLVLGIAEALTRVAPAVSEGLFALVQLRPGVLQLLPALVQLLLPLVDLVEGLLGLIVDGRVQLLVQGVDLLMVELDLDLLRHQAGGVY